MHAGGAGCTRTSQPFGMADGASLDGTDPFELVHPEDHDRVQEALENGLATGEFTEVGFRMRRVDDGWIHVIGRGRLTRDEFGRPLRADGISINATALVEAREREAVAARRVELLLDSAGEGVIGIDRQGTNTLVNRVAAELLGWSQQALRGCNRHETAHARHEDGSPRQLEHCPMAPDISEKQVVTDDVLWRRDGTALPVEYAAVPVADAEDDLAVMIVFRDITERRRADHLEEELSMYHRGANMQEAISLTRTVLFNQERNFMRMVFFKVWKRILSILRKPMIAQAMSQVCFQQAFLIF